MAVDGGKVRAHLKAQLDDGEDRARAVVYTLMETVRHSKAGTIMGIEQELKEAAASIDKVDHRTHTDVRAALETFLSSIGRLGLGKQSFEEVKASLFAEGEAFLELMETSRERIAQLAGSLIADGASILTISKSRAVTAVLAAAVAEPLRKNIQVFVAESRVDSSGFQMAARLQGLEIPTTVLTDAAIGAIMEKIDVVLVGAEAAVENGGVVNRVGTFQLAMAAKAFNKPFYVAVESYKFARLYPLRQSDLVAYMSSVHQPFAPPNPDVVAREGLHYFNPIADLTPPALITLLMTDRGILTPAAVSEMLIRAT